MEHDMVDIDLGNTDRHQRQFCARCSCGFLTPVVNDRQKNDDEKMAHRKQAFRDRVGVGKVARPNLATTLKHYDMMAAHPAATVSERTQWVRLAEEVRERLAQTTVDNTLGQGSLLDMIEE